MWLRLSKWCGEHPIETLRWIMAGQKIIEETFPFRQLNASVKNCYEGGARLVKHLGFVETQRITHEEEQWSTYSKRIST
jgi:hypothetical protein